MPRVRKRRYEGARWITLVAFFGALLLEGGVGLVYEHVRETPLPKLFVHVEGEGRGIVLSQPAGIACGAECVAGFEEGTAIKLTAILGEGSTFEGWPPECETSANWPLECTLVLDETTHVRPRFGAMPDAVSVAWAPTPERARQELDELHIALPDPAEEADLLAVPLVPVEELLAEPPKPEKKKPQLQPPQEAPPKTERQVMQQQMKAVEVPDENEVEEAPDDAHFLSDKNRDVAEETRAKDTNLERQSDGEVPYSEESDVESDDIGAEEEEIAQLDDVDPTSLDAERQELTETRGVDDIGQVPRGEGGDEGEDGKPKQKGMLSMRDIEGRGMPGGTLVILKDDDSDDMRPGRRGKRGIKTDLDYIDDYERIVGKEVAEREVALGSKRRSKRRGRWERKQAAVRSALENFIPEVRPGNQTALKTRAAPFALYIARMHRKIHELWGFGFLEELDGKPASDPLNDWSLETVIEVSVNPDGTVHKTTIVKNSGILRFDVAAIDVVLSAAPYDPTPEKIRSVDGRVWLHWTFRRDWEQCGTFNTRMFILTEVSDNKIDDGEMVRKMRPRKKRRGGSTASRLPEPDPGAAAASARAHANLAAPDDPRAKHAANLWVSGFVHGNVAKMLKVTGAPFSSGKRVVANSVAEVRPVYENILAESRGKVREWKLFSPGGYRRRFGVLPAGADVGVEQLLMVVRLARERFTLILKRTGSGAYEVIGFHR